MGDVDLEQIARDAAGFRGRFAAVSSCRDNYAEGEMALKYASDGSDEPTEIADEIQGEHIAAPLARMLNAVPVLLAEIARLRNAGRNACVLAMQAPVKRERVKELLDAINRKGAP
jgi:hypothetical protein